MYIFPRNPNDCTLTIDRSRHTNGENKAPSIAELNLLLYVALKGRPTLAESTLTDSSEAIWKGTIHIPAPVVAYGLPLGFNRLLPAASLPWHMNHQECEALGREEPRAVESFVLSIAGGNERVLVPFETAIIAGCGLCAFLRKIAHYMRKPGAIGLIASMELVAEIDGRRVVNVVHPEHGVKANDILLGLLETIPAGTLVTMTLHRE